MKKIIALIISISVMGCTRPDSTVQFLNSQGYTNIEITGWRPFMKSEEDVFSTGFVAKNGNGKFVSGAVTEGWFKGKTIRFD